MNDISIPCSLAIEEFQRARRNVYRFWNLLYAVGATTAAMLIVALVSIWRGDTGAAIGAGVSSIVTGGGMLALIRLKDQALTELHHAQDAVRTDCVGVGQESMRGVEPPERPTPEAPSEVLPSEVVVRLTEL